MTFADKFAQTDFGRIHYIDEGEGEAILLTHSGGASLHEFDGVVERLSKRARVIAWDVPGHGDSAPATRHYSFRDYARAAIGLLDALGIEKAHVAGCSLGGMLSITLAAHHAERLGRAVIVDAQLRRKEWWAENWNWIEDMFSDTVQSWEQVAPRFRDLDQKIFRQWNIDRQKAGTHAMIDVLWAAREYDLLDDLGEMKVPVMMMAGAVGPTMDSLDEFRSRVPEGRLEIFEECGHFLMIDKPAEFQRVLLDFLEI